MPRKRDDKQKVTFEVIFEEAKKPIIRCDCGNPHNSQKHVFLVQRVFYHIDANIPETTTALQIIKQVIARLEEHSFLPTADAMKNVRGKDVHQNKSKDGRGYIG